MKDTIELVLFVVGIILAFIPGVLWFFEPELTTMQLSQKYWFFYATGMIIIIFVIWRQND